MVGVDRSGQGVGWLSRAPEGFKTLQHAHPTGSPDIQTCEPCELLPPLGLCVRGILRAFDQHASKDGDRSTLSKKELRQLMRTETGPDIEKAPAQRKPAELFDLMDQDGDQRLDFPEFLNAVGVVTCLIHDRLWETPIARPPPVMMCDPGEPPDEPIVCVMPPCDG